jgi:hypothetical protein
MFTHPARGMFPPNAREKLILAPGAAAFIQRGAAAYTALDFGEEARP